MLALRKLWQSVDARWVEWAVSMLMEGHDTPSLRVLAGEARPFNQLEITDLVDRTFEEPGLRQFASPAEAVASASVLAQQPLDGTGPVAAALCEIAQVCIQLDDFQDIYDIYLLHHARTDLQANGWQHYWPDANMENIDELIRDYCRKCLSNRQADDAKR